MVPFLIFVLTLLGAGIGLQDFYVLPSPVAVIVSVVSALILRGSVDAKIYVLIRGCVDFKIMTMCLIYLLAGAFATVSDAEGGGTPQ